MIRGIYTAAAGMQVEMDRQTTIANNLANINTTGFKRDDTVVKSFPQLLLSRVGGTASVSETRPPVIGELGTGALVDGIYTDYSNGGLRQTDAPLDLAISGDGYFTIQTAAGLRYTRDGSFTMKPDGTLVTSAGDPVLGTSGPIRLGSEPIVISSRGEITQKGSTVGNLQIATIPGTQLRKEGNSLYTATGAVAPSTNPQVRQGYLENANVNAVQEMVSMINVSRAYELSAKVVSTLDETLTKAVSEVGRLQ